MEQDLDRINQDYAYAKPGFHPELASEDDLTFMKC